MKLQPHERRATGLATPLHRPMDQAEAPALDLAIQECRRAEELARRESLRCLEPCFRRTMLKAGLPRRIYVDSGGIYQARSDSTILRKGGHPV